MGAMTRKLLCRLSPLFWLAAIGLVIAHDTDRHIHVLGWIIVATGLGVGGTLTGAISATAAHEKTLLLSALVANRPPGEAPEIPAPENPAPDLRAV